MYLYINTPKQKHYSYGIVDKWINVMVAGNVRVQVKKTSYEIVNRLRIGIKLLFL